MADEFEPIVWVEELPPQGGKNRELAWFAAELRKRPGEWAILPGRSGYANQITKGRLAAFPVGEFEAVSRRPIGADKSATYVRFVGEGTIAKLDDHLERRRQRLEG